MLDGERGWTGDRELPETCGEGAVLPNWTKAFSVLKARCHVIRVKQGVKAWPCLIAYGDLTEYISFLREKIP